MPEVMAESGRRANQYENAVLDLVEAGVLSHRVGEEFDAVVVELDEKEKSRGTVTIQEPAIEAPVVANRELPLGEQVRVRLTTADVASRKVEFQLA